jgi:methylenetetrahydrofolate reductase (NADPH)
MPASIEVTVRQVLENENLPYLFPKAERVYLPDLGTDAMDSVVKAARRLRDCGYEPVPHFAARRIPSGTELDDRIRMLAQEAGVRDVLVIAGGLATPSGPFSSTLDVLNTGVFDKAGIEHIGVAGHPEGSPDFSEDAALEALRLKQAFGERSSAKLRIVTQFGFDADRFVQWSAGLRDAGVDLPVHLGVAGPAKITTLIKYAVACGVGNSISMLRKRAGSLVGLAAGHSPEEFVEPIEKHVCANRETPITQIHVFPFGGVAATSEWLVSRGSWSKDMMRGR